MVTVAVSWNTRVARVRYGSTISQKARALGELWRESDGHERMSIAAFCGIVDWLEDQWPPDGRMSDLDWRLFFWRIFDSIWDEFVPLYDEDRAQDLIDTWSRAAKIARISPSAAYRYARACGL